MVPRICWTVEPNRRLALKTCADVIHASGNENCDDTVTVPRQWPIDSPSAFNACLTETFREIYGYAALFAGHDRRLAETIASEVYSALARRAASGEMIDISYGQLRTATRNRWLARWASDDTRPSAAATSNPMLADLPRQERTVIVLCFVDDLSVTKIAERLSLHEADVELLLSNGLRHLRGSSAGHA